VKLYHFSPAHLVESIQANGLTLGKLPIIDEGKGIVRLFSPCQWLTKEKNFNSQSWATRNIVTYDRTAFRIILAIPKSHRAVLCRAHDYLPQLPKDSQRLITDWEGSEHWYLFFGNIPSGWIRKIEPKEDTP